MFLLLPCINAYANSSQVPVFFIHQGDSYYLQDAFWQAKQFNSHVILIGDETNSGYSEVKHYLIGEYNRSASEFKNIYVHMSDNPYHYELICIQRWFILNEFMDAHGLDKCFYCDSDVMLYCNATDEYINFQNDNFSLSFHNNYYPCGHVSFWQKHALQEFCNFIIRCYGDVNKLNTWKKWYEAPNREPGGICDMTLLSEFIQNHASRDNNEIDSDKFAVGNMAQPNHYTTFDHNINVDELCYEMFNVNENQIIKHIIIGKDNFPYCYNKVLKRLIKFKALHFQGGAKPLMSKFRCKKL